MTQHHLKEAMAEAKRFTKACQELQDKRAEDRYAFMGCKESAAVRRASMDLTRALARLRNG